MTDQHKTPGPREKAALQALARARDEDAKDASLPPCKMCGGKAIRGNWIGGESTGGGYATVQCGGCGQEQRISLDTPRAKWPSYRYWSLEEAEAEVLHRWRTLNG